VNEPEQTEVAARIARAIVGDENVVRDFDVTMGAEDFSYMLNEVPGCYVWSVCSFICLFALDVFIANVDFGSFCFNSKHRRS
jgi:ABC-type multidrug transport system permease subunit